MQENSTSNATETGSTSRRAAVVGIIERTRSRLRSSPVQALAIAALGLIVVVAAAYLLWPNPPQARRQVDTNDHREAKHEGEKPGEGNEVQLSPDALAASGIEVAEVGRRPVGVSLRFTGTVEANQQQTQQVTPLVSGRVERVNVALGDRVRAGQVLAIIASPEVAEMHGKLHEAETRLDLADKNYARVQRSESRVAVIQAKARLDEAEATLRRTQRLVELGAGAGKDLIAAEAAHRTAKAEYEYQSNISINKEVQQARAERETARVEVLHLRNSLRALGANVSESEHQTVRHDTSTIALVAPLSGSVTERLVNAGAGIEAGKPLFTISDISTLWVIANVAESQVSRLRIGTPAEMRAAALPGPINGKVTYIAPALNEETRTARVRIEVNNHDERLKAGMFVEVYFEALAEISAAGDDLAIPEAAIQRLAERAIVFIPKQNKEGHFEVRDVEIGSTANGYTRIISGLAAGERIVTTGSFTLKTQLLKGELGEEH
jgi:cobalt-zinc-cadmium efflux system membrane fusion protein